MLSAGFFDADFAVFFAHQLFKLALLAALLLRRLLVEASLFNLFEKAFFGDSSLESLQQLLGSFPAANCHTDQVSPLSLNKVR